MSRGSPRVPPFHFLPLLLAAISCSGPSTRVQVARLAARVDSLALVVATMKAAIRGGPLVRPETVTVGVSGASSLGPVSAPVTIVEFTDYQCPFCARHAHSTLPGLLSEFVKPGVVRYVIRDLPLGNHTQARRAAQAARCAGSQGSNRYWLYHDALFDVQSHLADSTFVGIARRLALDLSRFKVCLESPAVAALVQLDAAEAEKLGLVGTPSFVVGRVGEGGVKGIVIPGALPLARFREVIRGVLSQPGDVASAKAPHPRPLSSP
jgi:protein-disulfide isomerase